MNPLQDEPLRIIFRNIFLLFPLVPLLVPKQTATYILICKWLVYWWEQQDSNL